MAIRSVLIEQNPHRPLCIRCSYNNLLWHLLWYDWQAMPYYTTYTQWIPADCIYQNRVIIASCQLSYTHIHTYIYHAIACIHLYKLLFLNGWLFFSIVFVEGIKVFALDLFYALGARLDVVFLQLKSLCYQNLVLFIWYPSCVPCQNWNKWIARICLTISAVWYNYVTYSSLSECVMAAVPIFFLSVSSRFQL